MLTHAENIHLQKLCVELWVDIPSALPLDDPCRKFDAIFVKHLQVIERFNRFPHRNEVLGRICSAEEDEFLNDPSYRFDLPMKSYGSGFTNTTSFTEKKYEKTSGKNEPNLAF